MRWLVAVEHAALCMMGEKAHTMAEELDVEQVIVVAECAVPALKRSTLAQDMTTGQRQAQEQR